MTQSMKSFGLRNFLTFKFFFMKIGLLGTGRIASQLGEKWAKAGHDIYFGSRTPQKAGDLAQTISSNTHGGSYAEAAKASDVLLLAFPWNALDETLSQCGDLKGKILIDCINPLAGDWRSLSLGFSTSAAEEIAKKVPQAHVVKAFNTISDKVMRNGATFESIPSSAFYCGDSAEAKAIVKQLISDVDFEPVDCGELKIARYLEPMACLFINVAIQGYGADIAFKLLQRNKMA